MSKLGLTKRNNLKKNHLKSLQNLTTDKGYKVADEQTIVLVH